MAMNVATSRTVAGLEVPPVGRWDIDAAHSHIDFIVRHMMISKVRGRFREFSGVICIDEVPEHSSVTATVKAASIDTGDEERDRHLRSADFLDVEHHPEIRFRSLTIRPADREHWKLTGELTVKDVTRPVMLMIEYCGTAVDPWGNTRAAFLATGEINREDFAITWNQALEAGGFLVGKGVKIDVDVEAVLRAEQEGSAPCP
ncbi:MAG TPA: YceI family protein [Acidimicrobiia bacterium]|jgi:polyisoprenoid-binding protein YceI